MGRKKRCENPDGFYEIKVLKNEEISYFFEDVDFGCFYDLLKNEKKKNSFEIIAYAFYQSGVDIIIKEENYTQISSFLGNILRLYSSYYKRKYSYEEKVFKSRYHLLNIKKENLSEKVVALHSRFLSANWNEKDKYSRSSLPEYFLKKEICDINAIYDEISQKDFYLMQYDEKNFENEDLKDYICRFAGIEEYGQIKTVLNSVRDNIIADLYYNKKVGAKKIGELFFMTRQGVYSILKKRQKAIKETKK